MEPGVTFKRPPVVETVLSVQFDRLPGLMNAHLGAFWQRRNAEWPSAADAPPLDEQFEAFGEQSGWNRAIQLKLTQAPSARLQMRNVSGDRMIQVQNCRLDYNWIGMPGQEYPRYRTVRPEFDRVLDEFAALIAEHGLGDLVTNQWEVTYVNHMIKGTVWHDPSDWADVFSSLLGMPAVPEGMRLEGFGGHWHFEIEPRRGRLHVEIQHAYVGGPEGKEEALAMKLTARGPIDRGKALPAAIGEGLNLGHEVIVTSFEELTSQQAHDYWNMESSDGDG